MAEEDSQDKTEKATPRKLEQAKEKGEVAKSRDFSSIMSMSGIVMIFYMSGEYFVVALANLMGASLSNAYGTDPINVSKIMIASGAQILAPFVLSAMALGVISNVVQSGVVIKPLKFEVSKVNPLKGIKKIFSMSGLTELFKSVFKFLIGGWVVYYVLKKDFILLPSLTAMELPALAKVAGSMVTEALLIAFGFYFIIAIIGLIMDRMQFDRQMKMSKQEIREEHKQVEGDPIVKSRIRAVQREAARKRMMQEVPEASVVITNPTHLAVALKYEENGMSAPKIVAKGAGEIAKKIRELAAAHGVPIIEDKPVARSLFKFDLNSFVPEELFVAVARILAHVYQLRGKI
ncbi:MAG: flagellar biosynthesis protein FlhB [Nitrospira sp.]|nr:flagellar biosynthesis protein FlhB [bacterium]MBL7048055.1 flagellar biosynthesis protein FlhB [Nitrospira sp.]